MSLAEAIPCGVWGPSLKLLNENPKFAEVWNRIVEAIDPSTGLTSDERNSIGQVMDALRTNKERYLEEVALRGQVYDIYTDLKAKKTLTKDQEILLKSLELSLEVAVTMQCLSLPKDRGNDPLNASGDISDPENDENEFEGDPQNLDRTLDVKEVLEVTGNPHGILGLTAEDVIHENIKVKEVQGINSGLVPQIEQRIGKLVQSVAEWCEDDMPEPSGMQLSLDEVVEYVAKKAWDVQNAHDLHIDDLMELIEESSKCLEARIEAWKATKEIVEDHALGSEMKQQKEELDYFKAMISLHEQLSECVYYQILSESYTSEVINALSEVEVLIDRESQAAQNEIQQLNMELEARHELGEKYESYATAYQKIKDEISVASKQLNNILELEKEVDLAGGVGNETDVDMRP